MAPASTTLLLAALAASASTATILGRDSNDAAKPAVLSLPVYQDVRTGPHSRLRRKRDLNTNAKIYNVTSTSYLIELDLGNPGQRVKVAIDTGSSELWVNPNCENAGSEDQEDVCNDHGHYRPDQSDSVQISSTESNIQYGKGQVNLQYVADGISVPGTDINLENVIFGYGLDSEDLTTGIMGLSFGDGVNMRYPSVIDELVEQNITKSRTLGVALGTKNEPTGSGVVSFGGVDTKKYRGKLHTEHILGAQNGENLERYWVQLKSVGLSMQNSDPKDYSNSSMPIFFDTGATLSYFPSSLLESIAEDLNGVFERETQLWVVPCGQRGSIDFTFGNYTVQVPLNEFIWNVGSNTCILGADSADDGSYILGDSFLRSVYTVFDQDTPALHFASYVNCGSNLREIPAGANATQKFEGECSQGDVDAGNDAENSASGSGGGTSNDDGNAAASLSPSGIWTTVVAMFVVHAIFVLQ